VDRRYILRGREIHFHRRALEIVGLHQGAGLHPAKRGVKAKRKAPAN
jgi:hypothetical protein